ncbi:TIGR04282 family arsenosugar biosynthesis glycosyltransferase [Haloflavibacter putidus]|uniref:Glycosyltransferase n=1 Tax=Haloflavibacter putidus TaxID=2576776 RepID=A0A507ZY34_9FLAO|nr:TIGR04282 family arsenosugar biosynthesis glycosyltransferase [Haloflavibacter putidus]TQD38512.1 glycosyltransferase [Haloflavibacter putidus]
MKNKRLLLIFTKNPILGKCKTRLAKAVGEKLALEIYHYLLKHTANVAQKVEADKCVYYSENVEKNDYFSESEFQKKIQYGGNLGERMHNAFQEGFTEKYSQIIIIGSDMLAISAQEINRAFKHLEKYKYVIGPAQDGGYYLLGMRQLHPTVFRNKKWSSSSVFKETMRNLPTAETAVLEVKNDIDTIEDIDENSVLQKFINV